MRWAALDDLIATATRDTEDVRAARELYSDMTGRVHDEHELFAERSDAFVEWYLLERAGREGGRTPVQRLLSLLRDEAEGPTAAEPQRLTRPVLQALARSYRSLFLVTALGGHQQARRLPSLAQMATRAATKATSEVRRPEEAEGRHAALSPRGHGLLLRDLLGGGIFEVDERRRLPGINVGDIFEARLAPDPDEPYRLLFTRTFLCHPREAQGALLALAAAARQRGEEREQVLFRLQRLRLRCTAYRHVPAQRIYAQAET